MFGEVAELYDRHRPSYPSALVDDLTRDAGVRPGDRVLEVGAGTGKATALFAARGLAVVAVEPSHEMAALARRNLAGYRQVEVVESDFERWEPGGETFGLLYSAQAWHWVDPNVRYQRARRALVAGGLLATFWNRAAWGPSELRNALLAAYDAVAPGMSAQGPMHPANASPEGDENWPGEIAGVTEFEDPAQRRYRWSRDYSAEDYVGLLSTLSEFRLLGDAARRRLLSAVRQTIEEHGGVLSMPMLTVVNLARAV